MLNQPAILALENGVIMDGISVGASGTSTGEIVFNTSMTGYQEILTDPSYARQIITLTAAHVGNTGCNEVDRESSRIWAAGLVIRNYCDKPSNYRSNISLGDWLKKHNIVAIANIDTRHLTHILRELGAQSACISTNISNPEEAIQQARSFKGLQGLDLAAEVTRQTIERWHSGRGDWGHGSQPQRFHVVAYDFGIKDNILRILHEKGCHVTLVSAKTSAEEVINLRPDGVFLSNGPGDPAMCDYAINATQQLLKANIPIFGICLGHQILALALGAKTIKMKFGHHGANHPVIETNAPHHVFITSQNHGFNVDETNLPETITITHRSLFDNTLQGFAHKTKPAYGFQGHPEASPGPHDLEGIFNPFIQMMNAN